MLTSSKASSQAYAHLRLSRLAIICLFQVKPALKLMLTSGKAGSQAYAQCSPQVKPALKHMLTSGTAGSQAYAHLRYSRLSSLCLSQETHSCSLCSFWSKYASLVLLYLCNELLQGLICFLNCFSFSIGVEVPGQGKKYICAAFPSACGKTNLAMMRPTLPGFKVRPLHAISDLIGCQVRR
jgi:hypothetical protein